MSKVENYTSFAENIARDNTHGYDQRDRNGNPNYDCSGLVCDAVERAGIKVKEAGASYTGNMLSAFKKAGFKDITSQITLSTGAGLKRGDVLLSVGHHTAIYCGGGKMVDARINEKGTTTEVRAEIRQGMRSRSMLTTIIRGLVFYAIQRAEDPLTEVDLTILEIL